MCGHDEFNSKYNLDFEKKEYFSDWIVKIFWHYDITAVLKCIREHILNCCHSYDDNFIYFKNNNDVFEIPNKPLTLYSEQEDIKLLEILKKLN